MVRKVAAPKAPETPAPYVPKFNEIMIHDQKDGIEDIPAGPAPSYRLAGDGLFLVRKTLLGVGMIKQRTYMNWLKETGIKGDGNFEYDAPMLPAKLTAQIQDFFLRIWNKQHTEAAVLLIMHEDTREWRIFIPTQLVSTGGVNYVYDRSHISKGWLVAGSIHSHCDFGAGHSGTDTGDAEGFEGVHFTFGHNNRTKDVEGEIRRDPSRVCMVYMNKTRFDYQPDTMADFSELGQHPAPEWWDQYVGPPLRADDRKPVGYELFKKLGQATEIKEERKPYSPNSTGLRAIAGPAVTNPGGLVPWGGGASKPYQPQGSQANAHERHMQLIESTWRAQDEGVKRDWDDWTGPDNRVWLAANGWEWDEKRGWTGPADRLEQAFYSGGGVTNESREFNARQRAAYGDVEWNDEGGLEVKSYDDRDIKDPKLIAGLNIAEYWEDHMPKGFMDRLMGTDMVTEDDVDWAMDNYEESVLPSEWAERLLGKVIRASTIIAEHSSYRISIHRDTEQTKGSHK